MLPLTWLLRFFLGLCHRRRPVALFSAPSDGRSNGRVLAAGVFGTWGACMVVVPKTIDPCIPTKGRGADWGGVRGGGTHLMHSGRPYTLASLQCQDGARRDLADQEEIDCTQREAP